VLYRATLPGIAYGAAAAWQTPPLDHARFLTDYCDRLYGGQVAAEMAAAIKSLDEAEQAIQAALGSEDMFRLWDDPLAPDRLQRARARVADLRKARLAAEDAEECMARALALGGDPYSISSLLLVARLVDYAGMKFLYTAEIAEGFAKLGPTPTRADLSFWIDRPASSRNHSRMGDLMDRIGELRDEYRQAWEQEYTSYRRATALGRFDAEFEYWRRLQARFWEVRRTFREGGPAPKLESLRP
jgi:hypothetical protein